MVNKIITKPHIFFFGLVPIFIILAFLSKDKTLDINIYDIYFVITNYHFFLFSAIFFAMLGINYFSLYWAEKTPKKWLTIGHISLQIISFLFLLTRNNWNWINSKSYSEIGIINDNSNLIIFIAFLIFLLSVFIHLINFFTSLFLKKQ